MSDPRNIVQILKQGLKALHLQISHESLLEYLYLLDKWNQAYNLTAVKDIDAMVIRHLLDSLAITPWIQGPRVIDVGSGAGLPGIPLAILHPEWQFTLLDSNGKKVRFMLEAKRLLKLTNVDVIQSRAENFQSEQGFDTVTSRAFSDLNQMIHWTKHLPHAQGIWLAMKGRYPEIELSTINRSYKVQTYTVPGLEEERCCVIIDNS